jgi:hypothetical protein
MADGSQLTLTDTTLRHQSLIGVMADKGKLTLERVSVLGSTATSTLRAALYVGSGASADVDAFAVPWAQGVGVMVDSGAQLALTGSLVANVIARDQGQEAILVSGGNVTVTSCELAYNQQNGVVAIGGATVSLESTLVHDSTSTDGSPSAGAVILHSSAAVDGSFFARNGEGIDAAGSGVVATNTVLLSHHVALRAMDGKHSLALPSRRASRDGRDAASARDERPDRRRHRVRRLSVRRRRQRDVDGHAPAAECTSLPGRGPLADQGSEHWAVTPEPTGHGVVSASQWGTCFSWDASHAVEPQRQFCAAWQQMLPSQSCVADGSNESLRKQEQPSLVGEHETVRHVHAVPALGQVAG